MKLHDRLTDFIFLEPSVTYRKKLFAISLPKGTAARMGVNLHFVMRGPIPRMLSYSAEEIVNLTGKQSIKIPFRLGRPGLCRYYSRRKVDGVFRAHRYKGWPRLNEEGETWLKSKFSPRFGILVRPEKIYL